MTDAEMQRKATEAADLARQATVRAVQAATAAAAAVEQQRAPGANVSAMAPRKDQTRAMHGETQGEGPVAAVAGHELERMHAAAHIDVASSSAARAATMASAATDEIIHDAELEAARELGWL